MKKLVPIILRATKPWAVTLLRLRALCVVHGVECRLEGKQRIPKSWKGRAQVLSIGRSLKRGEKGAMVMPTSYGASRTYREMPDVVVLCLADVADGLVGLVQRCGEWGRESKRGSP